jgi:predicted nucleic acid-binding protein
MVHLGAIKVAFTIKDNALDLSELMLKYHDLPMSLADACLVLMAERLEDPAVLTMDSHFRIYRTQNRRVIRTIMPPEP